MALGRLVPIKITVTGVRSRGAPQGVKAPPRGPPGGLAPAGSPQRAPAPWTRTSKSPPRRPCEILPYAGPVHGTAGAQTAALPDSTLLSSQRQLPKSPMSGLGTPRCMSTPYLPLVPRLPRLLSSPLALNAKGAADERQTRLPRWERQHQ